MSLRELTRRRLDLTIAVSIALLGALIYLPYLGSFPLWDPWEPHYSQVAWEMQNQHTWLDPYYRNANNWWSKPILMLWLLRASFRLLWDARQSFPDHEFCARFPFALVAIVGGVAHYDWIRRLFGRAVGAMAAVTLLTSAQYLLIGRQVMADMAMVVAYSSAMGYLAVGLFADDNAREQQHWPYLAFWSLQALAVLAKGFVPPLLAVLALGSYGLLTFRSGDEAGATERRRSLGYALGRHALSLLSRMRAHWGIPLFLTIAGPWYAYMTAVHGRQYWHTFIFFHHLGRAAGTLSLPTGTFDFYLRQLGFALFPWTGFLVGGLVVFLGRCHPTRSVSEQRNLYVLCLIAAPMAFFMLSGTKFGHYVFPVVPACTVIVAASLVWLMRRGEPAGLAGEMRGTVAVVGLLALLVFVVLLVDIRHDVRHLLRLFVYYFNRTTPFEYQPARTFTLLGVPVAVVAGLLLLSRYVSRWHLIALGTSGVIFACYLGWVTMPAMDATYSYRPVYDAYRANAKPGDSVGQYNNWPQPERSVLFLFQNQAVHLNGDSAASIFLSRPGRKFVIVDRNRLADLRRVAKQLSIPLYTVFDDHPYARLLSTEPSPLAKRTRSAHILGELPAQVTTSDANFGGKIRLLGWKATPETLRPGQTLQVALYFEAISPIERNWKLLAHADNPAVTGHRLSADHFPAAGTLPTRGWQEGRIIEDMFTIQVPIDYPFESFFVWTGFFIGDERMPLSNSPPNDGFGRVRGPLVFVTQEKH